MYLSLYRSPDYKNSRYIALLPGAWAILMNIQTEKLTLAHHCLKFTPPDPNYGPKFDEAFRAFNPDKKQFCPYCGDPIPENILDMLKFERNKNYGDVELIDV